MKEWIHPRHTSKNGPGDPLLEFPHNKKSITGLKCPHCQGMLSKKVDTGQGVKYCAKCGSSWFILETSKAS